MEIWRVEYRPKAYVDQTGAWRDGYVVFERRIVEDTGERFDVNDGYKNHINHGRIYESFFGRRFKVWSETITYSGGTHVRPEIAPNIIQGYWKVAPNNTAMYINLDGTIIEPYEDPEDSWREICQLDV